MDALPTLDEELVGLCADEARARLMARAALAQGCHGECPPDVAAAWRKESREWSREVRQIFLTRKHALRDIDPADRSDPHRAVFEAFGIKEKP
jgi:hypothetical protein